MLFLKKTVEYFIFIFIFNADTLIGIKDENKDLKLRSKALSEEINVYKRVFKKGGLSEEQFKQVFKQAKQELYVEEKAKAIEVKKTRNYSMNMGR